MEGVRAYPTDQSSVVSFCQYCTMSTESDTRTTN